MGQRKHGPILPRTKQRANRQKTQMDRQGLVGRQRALATHPAARAGKSA